MVFRLTGDGKTLWDSGLMRGGMPAKPVAVDLHGVKKLTLTVEDGGDGMDFDHADWADAQIAMAEGKPAVLTPPREEPVVLTPKASPKPRINGARIVGVRPGSPFLFTIAASGDRPVLYSASHLPAGLQLDPITGIITGSLQEKGAHVVTLRAKNDAGADKRQLKIVCGDAIALTPPLGWNSWNCFACDVTDAKVRAAADAMVASGLIHHGWTYINIDDCWEGRPGRRWQACSPTEKFPDMKALTDYVHSKGLKIGLYSSPGPKTCAGHEGSYKHEEQDARRYAEWGFDYLKYDWCSYGDIAPSPTTRDCMKPYRVMRDRAGPGPARHRLQPLPVRHGQRVGMGRRGRRQLLAHHRRHHRHVVQHGRHRLQPGGPREIRRARPLE